jgi:hypothetical protein
VSDPFASPDDVAARWRPLTSDEQVTAVALCEDASAVIRARFPGIDSQIASGALEAGVVTMVAANMVKRAMIAPADGVQSQSQTDGPFSMSQTYANPLGNVFLTAAEVTAIIGYQPRASSHRYSNQTNRVEACGPTYVYGFPGY